MHCEQKIKHICKVNPLTGVSGWTDRNGNKNRYWYGDHSPSQNGCQCKEGNTCSPSFSMLAAKKYDCNCDMFTTDAVDAGILVSTTKERILIMFQIQNE